MWLILGLAATPAVPAETGADAELAAGIRQVREGELDAAVITLDAVVKRLSAQKGREKDLARAYTYLAIAYVGLAQQETAKAKFLEAWKADKTWTLSPKEFPPNIIEFFEQVRRQGEATAKAEPKPATPTPKPSPAPVAASAEKKGGGHGGLILLGVGGAAAVGIAVAAGGGGSGTSNSSNSGSVTETFAGSIDSTCEFAARFTMQSSGQVTAVLSSATSSTLEIFLQTAAGQVVARSAPTGMGTTLSASMPAGTNVVGVDSSRLAAAGLPCNVLSVTVMVTHPR